MMRASPPNSTCRAGRRGALRLREIRHPMNTCAACTDSPRTRHDRAFQLGLLFWAAFCVVAVLARGIGWDEACERAQAILRTVPYPEGHPFHRYARGAFTIQYYSAAALLAATGSEALLCGIRNVLFLMASLLPPYLLGALLSRRAIGGHVAATVTLAGAVGFFGVYYPLWVWPDRFSSGHIGMGGALIVLFLLAGGFPRAGGLGLGLMPCIHLGQAPVLFATFAVRALWAWHRPDGRAELRRTMPWLAGGLLLTGVVFIATRCLGLPAPESGPYCSTTDAVGLWRDYTFIEDIHRAFPRFNPFAHAGIALGLTALFVALLALRFRDRQGPDASEADVAATLDSHLLSWPALYVGIAAAAFLAALTLQRLLGASTPFFVVSWMPHRLTNHIGMLLPALFVGILAQSSAQPGRRLMFRVLLAPLLGGLALACVLHTAGAPGFATPYLNAPEWVVFMLAGGAAGALLRGMARSRRTGSILVAAALLALVRWHQFGAVAAAVGCTLALMTPLVGDRPRAAAWLPDRLGLAVLTAPTILAILAGQWLERQNLPVPQMAREIKAHLKREGDPAAMLVCPHWEIGWQETTGHPVLYTFETPQFVPYMRSLAPSINKIRMDIYDIRLGGPWDYHLEAWRTRTLEAWEKLGREYDFRYVLAPVSVPLSLAPVITGDTHILYEIPSSGQEKSMS